MTPCRSPWPLAATLACLVAVLPEIRPTVGQEPPPARIAEARAIAQAHRREWVRKQIVRLVDDPGQRAAILGQLNALPDEQIEAIAHICLDESEARKQAAVAALKEVNARTRVLEERAAAEAAARAAALAREEALARERFFLDSLAWGLGPYPGYYAPAIGYVPVVTWLPEGVGLTAQAVVSPDRRHVRMSVVPFFSSIGPVYTFNYLTGETRRYDR